MKKVCKFACQHTHGIPIDCANHFCQKKMCLVIGNEIFVHTVSGERRTKYKHDYTQIYTNVKNTKGLLFK